jgi:hypothetical protein
VPCNNASLIPADISNIDGCCAKACVTAKKENNDRIKNLFIGDNLAI